MQEALGAAYSNNPTLQTARAQLRSTDEGVPQALSGWRPTVALAGSVGYGDGTFPRSHPRHQHLPRHHPQPARDILAGTATATQQIYSGGGTRAATEQADNRVFGQRARLLSTEQQVFTDTINAFVGVIQAQQVLQLDLNNEQVLTRPLQATNDRFRVGEITRTDVRPG